MIKRILSYAVAVFLIALLPWWVVCIFLLVCLIAFNYFEVMIFGLCLDILYGVPGGIISEYGFMLAGIIFYIASLYIRPRLKIT